jgi:arabinose-5-phosphate isomerase
MESLTQTRLIEQFTQILKLEADSITRAAEQLQPSQIERALTLLAECKGKVVILAVGKSGIVGRKIAATLTSTGMLAVYLHPGEALHGDLGIVTAADVAILLSNSGETEEVIKIIPALKQRQTPLIAIVGNLNSTLARKADAVLNATVDREACPLNLAPTTSTTAALAIGDALAMTLMTLRGVTPEDFARNHPGGRLGKRLTMRVEDLMYADSEQLNLLPTASWIEVLTGISQGGAGAINVVNAQGYLVGLITDGDIRRCLQNSSTDELARLSAIEIMTPNPTTVTPDVMAYAALKLMEERPSQISVLPVVDADKRCLGLIRLHDIIRTGLS